MTRRSILTLIKAAAAPAIALFVIAHFAGFALFGPNGLVKLGDYRRERAERTAELTKVDAERATLRHHAALLNPRRVDPDYADELVRKATGQVRPDEVIIPIE